MTDPASTLFVVFFVFVLTLLSLINFSYSLLILFTLSSHFLADRHGKKGLSPEHRAQHGSRGRGRRKGKTVVHRLSCSLEDMYKGTTKNIRITRKRIQLSSEAKKAGMTKKESLKPCRKCNGTGRMLRMTRTLMGVVPMESKCQYCKGLGQHLSPLSQIVSESTTLQVHINKGSRSGTKVKFFGESDEVPGQDENGDLVIELVEKTHPVFRRKNADLLVQKKITLLEALSGVNFLLHRLDGESKILGNFFSPINVYCDPHQSRFSNFLFLSFSLPVCFFLQFFGGHSQDHERKDNSTRRSVDSGERGNALCR